MKRNTNNQRFWDEKNCRYVDALKFNGTDYYCRIIKGDDEIGISEYQWFSVFELEKFTRI